MDRVIEAVYENGMLRPKTPLHGLAEGQSLCVIVRETALALPEISRREDEFIRHIEAQGLLVHSPAPDEPPLPGWKPLVIEGEPLSETIIKDRR